ncbi:MAG: hypothetical protein ACRCYX_01065, partial [Dermatophilaceae bacterium]
MSSSLPYILIGGGVALLLVVSWLFVRQVRGSGASSAPPGPIDMNEHAEPLGGSVPAGAGVTEASAAPDVSTVAPKDPAPTSWWGQPSDSVAADTRATNVQGDAAEAFVAEESVERIIEPSAAGRMPAGATDRLQTDRAMSSAEPEMVTAAAATSEEPGREPEPAAEFEEETVSTTGPEKNAVCAAGAPGDPASLNNEAVSGGAGDVASLGGVVPVVADPAFAADDAVPAVDDHAMSAVRQAMSSEPGVIAAETVEVPAEAGGDVSGSTEPEP